VVIDFHTHVTAEGGLAAGDLRMDADVKSLICGMDRAGIQTAVLAPVVAFASDLFQPACIGTNEYVASQERAQPGRFVAFGTISGTGGSHMLALESDIRRLGLRGVKVHPILQGVHVNDPALDPLYEICEDLGIPVLIHSGGQPGPTRLGFARPILFDDVAAKHPRLAIVMAHAGGGMGLMNHLHDEALEVASKNANIFLGTSWTTDWVIKEALARVGPERLLFESDFPFIDPGSALGKLLATLAGIGLIYPRLLREGDIDLIVGGNARRLLKL